MPGSPRLPVTGVSSCCPARQGSAKSRLLTGLTETLAPDPHTTLVLFCAEPMADSPFHPLIGPISGALGIASNATAKETLGLYGGICSRIGTAAGSKPVPRWPLC